MQWTYIHKRAQQYAISFGFNFVRLVAAFVIYAAIGLAQRKEPPIYIFVFAFLGLQVVAWVAKEIDLYRHERGQEGVCKMVFGNLQRQRKRA